MIHVSPLSALTNVTAKLDRFALLTLLSPDHPQVDWREFACERHLRLAFHDIVEPVAGLTAPDREMMQAVVDFGRDGEDQRALLIHCWAGISRSTATAYIALCHLNEGHEHNAAKLMRAAARHAQPNPRLVAVADKIMGRKGRMIEAVAAMGPGEFDMEGALFSMPAKL